MGDKCLKSRAHETLPGGRHETLDTGLVAQDDTAVFGVPARHYLVMGGNRDNSTDRRMPQSVGGVGFVSKQQIVGKVQTVLLLLTGQPGRILTRV